MSIMGDLGIQYETDPRVFEVINKIDICDDDRRDEITRDVKFHDNVLAVSAQTGQGVDTLLSAIDEFLSRHAHAVTYELPLADGKALAWLYQHAEVIDAKMSP
jgi:GTP-binding protein HflX